MTTSAAELSSLRAELARREQARRAAELAELEALRAAAGRRRLADFVKAAWHVVEPGRPLVWGWHLDAVCDHLQAVSAGQITNLLITIPPGCTKSRTVAVFWPAWHWLRDPGFRWLFFSNEDGLATRDSLACRRLVESDWYALHYPDRPRLTTDQNVKTWFETDRGGHRQSLGIRASVTGKKGDAVVVDDANDAEKVEGEAERATINGRWDNAIYDRVIDFRTGRRVIVGQRTHVEDLIGHIRATGEFEELLIPEEFEPHRRVFTSIGWTDPRQEEGELLRPEQFGPDQAAAAKLRLGTIGYRAKHQQDPQTREGHRFKAAWLRGRWRRDGDWFVLEHPDKAEYRFPASQVRHRFGTADGAASVSSAADYTVISSWLVTPKNDLLWVGCRREKLEIPDQPAALKAEYDKHRLEWVGVEACGANAGLYQHAGRVGVNVKRLDTGGKDKLARATPALIFCEAGRLWLPAPGAAPGYPWDAAEAELLAFTGDEKIDAHNDVADTLAYAVRLVTSNLAAAPAPPPKGVGGLPGMGPGRAAGATLGMLGHGVLPQRRAARPAGG